MTSQCPVAPRKQTQGVTVDPRHNFVFAAGQDQRIRAWSLHSGQQLLPHTPLADSTRPNVENDVSSETRPAHFLSKTFQGPIPALQVTEDTKGLCLWAAAGREMYTCRLGVSDDYVLLDEDVKDGWYLG